MTWTKSGATITQTGTDTDLSGLNGISGVITTAFNSNFTIYDLGSNRLEIQGTLTHDPDVEMLVYSATGTDATTPVIVITSTGTYNYGVERTGSGNSAYSSGVGLMCVREDTGGSREWRANQKGLIQNNSGTLNLKGGAISSAKPLGLAGFNADSTDGSSTINVKNTKIFRPSGLASSERREIRLDDATNTILGSVENLIVDGFLITHRNLPETFSVTLVNAAIGQLAGGSNSSVLRDLDTSGNIRSDYDLGTDDDATGAKFYTVINASEGSNTRCMPKEGVGGNRQLGGAIIQKEVSFNVKNSSGSAIDGVKVYASDTDNSYRKNANGQDHTADKVYEYTTDANGDTETITVTTAITNIDSEDSSTTPITYTRWDTDFGTNRYKVDRRGLDDSGDDIFIFKLIEYGKSISTTNQALKGLGELGVNWVLFDDQLITDPRVITDDYTEIDTPKKFYNRAKAFLVDNYAGETQTIVTRDGNTIDAKDFNVVIDANADPVLHVEYGAASGDSSYSLDFDNFGTQMRITFTPEFEFYDEIKNGVYLDLNSNTDVDASDFYFDPFYEEVYGRTRLNFRKPSGSNVGRLYNIVANGNGTGWQWEILSGSNQNYLIQGSIGYLALTEGVNELNEIVPPQDPSTITIKASTFVGNIQTTGDISLLNGAEVIGTYGENTVLPWKVTNVEATATLQLFNITKNLEVENLVVAGTAGDKVESSGTYTGQEVSVGDNIRLRITCQAGTGAFLPYEAFGVATSIGISFEADQQPDTIYNENGINADNLTTLSADYPNVQIDISDGDGIADAREFYAFYVKQTTTSTGIGQWFGAIDAIDHMNYRVNTAIADIKLQNTGSIPLVISGARIFRDDGTSVLHADVDDQPMTQDNGELIQYIKGQVNESLNVQLPPAVATAINENATISGIDKNTKLIPALL